MKKLTATWKLRTDGRTVTDDLNDLRQNPERLRKALDWLRGLFSQDGLRPAPKK